MFTAAAELGNLLVEKWVVSLASVPVATNLPVVSILKGKKANCPVASFFKVCWSAETPCEISVVVQSNPPSSLTVQVKFWTTPNIAS